MRRNNSKNQKLKPFEVHRASQSHSRLQVFLLVYRAQAEDKQQFNINIIQRVL